MNVAAQAGRIEYNTRAVYVVYVCTVNGIDTVHCIACCVHGCSFIRNVCYSGFTYGYRVGAVCVY